MTFSLHRIHARAAWNVLSALNIRIQFLLGSFAIYWAFPGSLTRFELSRCSASHFTVSIRSFSVLAGRPFVPVGLQKIITGFLQRATAELLSYATAASC